MNDLIPAIAVVSLAVIVLSPFIINKIIKFKLEFEKMRLDAEIKKEEIRARNQYEIEKMLANDRKEFSNENHTQSKNRYYENHEESADKQLARERLRD
jgi:hypothetical protein